MALSFLEVLEFSMLGAGAIAILLLMRRIHDMRKEITLIARREDDAVTSEARLHELFDLSPTGLIVTRLSDGEVLYINPKLAKLLGGVPKDYLGKSAPDYYAHANDREQLLALLKKNGLVQDYELTLRHPSGEPIWASLSANIHHFGNEPAVYSFIIDISLRKDSEGVLIDATRSFRDLLQSAPAAILIADTESGKILFANQHAADLTGLELDALIGQSATSLYVNPEDRTRIIADLKKGLPVQNIEKEFRHFNGSPMWMRVSARLSMYEGKEALISIWDDITDRRQAEHDLRKSEKNHRLALTAAPFPLLIASSENRSILLLNQRARQALKISETTPLADLKADDFVDTAVRAEIGQMLTGEEEITDREALIRPRTGPRFWALVSIRKTEFEGDPAFLLSFTDISEHKRIEREIADSRATLRSMINASPIWMAMFDRSGYYLLVNKPFESLLGRSAPQIETRHFTEVLPRPLAERHAPLINRCIEGEVVEFEGELESSDFNPLATESVTTYIYGKYSPVIAKDGTVSGGVLAMIDVTEHHAANEKLKSQFQEINRLHQLLKEQVIRDPLTGLFNRRYLDETLDREVARARREGYPVCVIMIDIDFFKHLNDTYGHQAGDEVLKTLAQLFTEGMREGDMPCRYGGEEFTLVLPNANAETARQRAEGWRLQFETTTTRFGQFELKSTISLGIASYPEHGKTRDELIQAADAALYDSKHGGRNRTSIFSPKEATTSEASP